MAGRVLQRIQRILSRFAFPLLRTYWSIRRPVTLGVNAIVSDGKQVLLVRHSYREGWFLPGGGVARNESIQEALLRELKEEAGIEVIGDLVFLEGPIYRRIDHKHDHLIVFRVQEWTEGVWSENFEIVEKKFFLLSELPETLSVFSRSLIERHLLA